MTVDFTNKTQAELDEFIRKGNNTQKREAFREINRRANAPLNQLPYDEYIAMISIGYIDHESADLVELPLNVGEGFEDRYWTVDCPAQTITATLYITNPDLHYDNIWLLAAPGFTYSYVEDDDPGPGTHLGVKVRFTLDVNSYQPESPYPVLVRIYRELPTPITYPATPNEPK